MQVNLKKLGAIAAAITLLGTVSAFALTERARPTAKPGETAEVRVEAKAVRFNPGQMMRRTWRFRKENKPNMAAFTGELLVKIESDGEISKEEMLEIAIKHNIATSKEELGELIQSIQSRLDERQGDLEAKQVPVEPETDAE